MKAMYRRNTMHMFADACTAPAYQSASKTASCAETLDTAVVAVSFLLGLLPLLSDLVVRIIALTQAKTGT